MPPYNSIVPDATITAGTGASAGARGMGGGLANQVTLGTAGGGSAPLGQTGGAGAGFGQFPDPTSNTAGTNIPPSGRGSQGWQPEPMDGVSGIGIGTGQSSMGAYKQEDDKDMRRLTMQKTLEGLRRMRYYRRQYDPRRAYYYRQYLMQRDQRFYPDNLTPRSNTFVPYAHSNVETITARVMDAFFSMDPPIEVRGRGELDQAAAPYMQCVLLTKLHLAKWIDALEKLIRNICIYGHAGIKVEWDWDYDTVTAPDPVYAMMPQRDPMTGQPFLNPDGTPSMMPIPNPMTGQPIQLGVRVITKQIPRMRPKLIPIDVFDLLIDPDGHQVAYLAEKSFAALKREAEQHPEAYLPGAIDELSSKIKNEKDPDNILIRLAEYWNEADNTVTLMTFGEDAEAVSWKDLRYSYRNANYSSYKLKVYGGSPVLLQHGPNPYIHKRAPILCTSYTKLTGEPYGIGVVEKISDLNEALNKFCNMITDNWNMSINRRYAYDINANIDHTQLNQFNTPGGKVGVDGDPSKMIMPLPVMTPQASEFMIMDIYKQQIELASGISDFYGKGIGGPGGNRSATGIGQIMTETNTIFKLFMRNLELDILQPLLEMCASMIQQYCTDFIEYQVTDAPPMIPKVGRVALENIIGNYDFDFVGANYATNKVIRQRNMMGFYQIAMQSPYANQGEFLREIAKVMEIPNASRLIKPDQQVQAEQQQAMQAQQQLMVAEKLLDAEADMLTKEVGKKKEDDPESISHARDVQDTMEEILAAMGNLQAPPPKVGRREGRPATRQPEGQIPGTGLTGPTRSMAQSMGANATGLAGLGETGGTP